jgi:hypothetical protein
MNSLQEKFLIYFAAITLLALFIIVWFNLGLLNTFVYALLAGTIASVWAILGEVESD